jgi:NhaA family Na+:H+ antiporter
MSDPDPSSPFPRAPIDRLVAPLERFMHVAAASGLVLLLASGVALALANSPWSASFLEIWATKVEFAFGSFRMSHSLQHWIVDGLMAVFFFVIGLEVKRELVLGELRDLRKAALPVAAAIGGMVVPAGVYLAIAWGRPEARGWGIPMATDIAFVVGCMAVLGPRIPHGLRVMLLSLAIADDIGAILVIAVGYTETIHLAWLAAGGLGLLATSMLARLGVRSFLVYVVLGVGVWLSFHESGVHATIAGVILGLMTPADTHLSRSGVGRLFAEASAYLHGDERPTASGVREVQRAAREVISPLAYLEGALHPWSAFAIMPLFALANAGVPLNTGYLSEPVALAVAAGLVLGKPIGIVAFSWLAVRAGLADLPRGVGWGSLAGGGALAGIGFTMSIFIAGLALEGPALDAAKVGVLAGSALSASIGVGLLLAFLPAPAERADDA